MGSFTITFVVRCVGWLTSRPLNYGEKLCTMARIEKGSMEMPGISAQLLPIRKTLLGPSQFFLGKKSVHMEFKRKQLGLAFVMFKNSVT